MSHQVLFLGRGSAESGMPAAVGMSTVPATAAAAAAAAGCDVDSFLDDMCLHLVDQGWSGAWAGILLEAVLVAYSFIGLAIVCDTYSEKSMKIGGPPKSVL